MKQETNPIVRYVNRPTYLNAIKAKCAECVGCTGTHLEPGFRGLISSCTAYACPLYSFRPYRRKQNARRPETGVPA